MAVHGRFVAFDLARELLSRGHDVTLLTNYPAWAVARFGFPEDRVRSFWLHGLTARVAQRLHLASRAYQDAFLNKLFGWWVAGQLIHENWDVVQCWSGIATETLQALDNTRTLRQVVRGSAHIRSQARLLGEEADRTRTVQGRPTRWMIAREEREYALADQIIVLSTFAFDSFVREGVAPSKLAVVCPGAPVAQFRPAAEVAKQRSARIVAREPLRVLAVGTLSFRKGMWDTAAVVRALQTEPFQFRFVGPIQAELAVLVQGIRPYAEFLPKQPEAQLPAQYAWGDVFLLPTIEDGFQAVLSQAAASGLPILTTANGAGFDLVRHGENGWIVPVRTPEAIVERLRWCNAHREDLAAMAQNVYGNFRLRQWSDAAAEFENACAAAGVV